MYYGPVGYIVEFEITALLFLVVIMTRYFTAKRFPNQTTRLFSFIIWVAAIDIFLDIITSLIIDNVYAVPITLTLIVNAFFYFLQVLLTMLMSVYALAMVKHLDRKVIRRVFPMFIPALVISVMLISNPWTQWFFHVDPIKGYVHGPIFIYTYMVGLFYIMITFAITKKHKKELRAEESSTIYVFLVVIVASMIIQMMYPALLITGVAIALAITLMYFTIQNPESMLDNSTQAFTYEAMITYLRDRKYDKKRVQLFAVKIHNMSRINETMGIENGNRLLKEISMFLLTNLQNSWVFRMRSNCFVVISREMSDSSEMEKMVNERIAESWKVRDTEILLQATVCHVHADKLALGDVSPEEAVNYVERAFLQDVVYSNPVKIVTAGSDIIDKLKRSRKVEEALREAIRTEEGLELYFQPLWSVEQARPVCAEVLLRFNHPTLGNISPDEFVPIAENNGFVTAMDELVVKKTCEFIRDNNQCHSMGLESIEINLSALEFMKNRLPQILKSIMSQYEVNPNFLCFEITETAATESFELLNKSMIELGESGCRFALDDFGTGYANVSQVIQLPFSIVKLDRTLLYGSEIVLEDMARMFKRMNRITVIEGAETEEQAHKMKAMNVDYIQGYYYGRPMNQNDFVEYMKKGK